MRPNSIKSSKPDTRELFERADRMWNSGKLRNAFSLFLQAAKAGDRDSQLNIGYFYDKGIGVKRDLRKALRWYLTAYRSGDASAANNIGTIWRDRKEHQKALWWFKRAVKLGNEASNFAIAIHFLKQKSNTQMASYYLKKVCRSNSVSEEDAQQARKLLREIEQGC